MAWVDIVTAAGEERAQTIRDRKDARSTLAKEAVRVAARAMSKDPELAERTLTHVLGTSIRMQENREAIAKLTIEHLTADPPTEPANEPPSDDWMNVFEAHAEKASSERLRQHWARILDGEIRKPGSFSLQTLQFMSILDPRLATSVERVAPFVIDGKMIIQEGIFEKGELLLHLVQLESLGILRSDLTTGYEVGDEGIIALRYADHGIILETHPKYTHRFNVAHLTHVGREVFSIVDPQVTPDLVREFAIGLSEDFQYKKVTLVQFPSGDSADGNRHQELEVLIDRTAPSAP